MRAIRDSFQRRALASLFRGDDSLIVKSALYGWREILSKLREERLIEERIQEVQRWRFRHDQFTARAIVALLSGHAALLLAACIQAWCDLLVTLRHEAAQERLRLALAAVRLKQDEFARRAGVKLFDQQTTLLAKTILNAWRELAVAYRDARALEKVQNSCSI